MSDKIEIVEKIPFHIKYKESIRRAQARFYEKNKDNAEFKEKRNAQRREFYAKNKEILKEKSKNRYQDPEVRARKIVKMNEYNLRKRLEKISKESGSSSSSD